MEIMLWCYAGVLLGVLLLPQGGADHPSMPAMGCSCPTYHPQNHLCQIADVVFRAIIMWKEPTEANNSALIGSSLTYSMLTDKIYKRHPKAKKGREILVQTSDSSAMCGVTGLKVNEEYLISGNVIDGDLVISLCNFIRPWSQVTAMQKSAFKSDYKDHCDTCYVKQEHNRQMRSTNESSIHADIENNIRSMCTHNPHQSALLEMEDCETEYSACVLHHRGHCTWHMNRKYEKCVARRGRKTKDMEAKQASMLGPQSIKHTGYGGKGGSKSSKKQKSKRGKKKIY